MPTLNRPDPPYIQVASHFREQITSGVLAAGAMLPSARQIARDWEITLATATKALGVLRSEGLVQGVPGKGTIVQSRPDLHQSPQDRAISIDRTGKIYPPGHYARIHHAELVASPQQVASALGLEPGAPVIRRHRTTYNAEDEPLSTSVSWFAGSLARVAPLLLETGRIKQGTAGYIAETTGHVISATYAQHAATSASHEAAAELNVAPGSPVLITQNRFVDQDGEVIEYGESTSQPDQFVFYQYHHKELSQ